MNEYPSRFSNLIFGNEMSEALAKFDSSLVQIEDINKGFFTSRSGLNETQSHDMLRNHFEIFASPDVVRPIWKTKELPLQIIKEIEIKLHEYLSQYLVQH